MSRSGSRHTDPGLHVKVPFIQTVFTLRQTLARVERRPEPDPHQGQEVHLGGHLHPLAHQGPAAASTSACTDERSAQSRLDDIVDGETRNVIANNDLIEVVRSTDRAFPRPRRTPTWTWAAPPWRARSRMGRDKITRAILDKSRHIVAEFGIELVDVQIRRINYVAEVQQKVYDRMISERKRIAERSRSEGNGKAAEIRGQKERELKGIQSEAYRKAQEVMGKADGEATRIYAEAYGRDPELYQFLKTMETYRKTFAPDTTLAPVDRRGVLQVLETEPIGSPASDVR